MRQYVHLVARAHRMPLPLTDHEVASWLWTRLRDAFPDALSAALMPNHSHVFTPEEDADRARLQLSALLSGLRRSKSPGACIEWEPVATQGTIAEPQKIERHVRYIVLNPSRAELVRDPLCWLWSTHRDVMGAAVDPWVTAPRLASALGRPHHDFRAAHHAYVSSDPSVRVNGTPGLIMEPATGVANVALGAVIAAACAATRGVPEDIRRRTRTRRVFLLLAWRQGWRDAWPGDPVRNLETHGVLVPRAH